MVLAAAARARRAPPSECVVIGDIGADVDAARAAGARPVLVPTAGHPAAGDRPPRGRRSPAATCIVRAVDARSCAGSRDELRDPARRPGAAVRLDSDGDVLLAGPARARGRGRRRPGRPARRRRPAARRPSCCPGSTRCWSSRAVDRLRTRRRSTRPRSTALVDRLRALGATAEAVMFTSFHQSPLPMALLARLAGIPRIARDQRRLPGLAAGRAAPAAGGPATRRERRAGPRRARPASRLPPGDDGRLRLRRPLPDVAAPGRPAAATSSSIPAPRCRPAAWPPSTRAAVVAALAAARLAGGGHRRPGRASAAAAVAGRDGRRPRPGARASPSWPRVLAGAPRASWSATPGRRTWPPRSARRSCRSSRRWCPPNGGRPTGCRPCCSATRRRACRDSRARGVPGGRPPVPAGSRRRGRRRRRHGRIRLQERRCPHEDPASGTCTDRG